MGDDSMMKFMVPGSFVFARLPQPHNKLHGTTASETNRPRRGTARADCTEWLFCGFGCDCSHGFECGLFRRVPRAQNRRGSPNAWRPSPTANYSGGRESSHMPGSRTQTLLWLPPELQTDPTTRYQYPGSAAASCAIISGLRVPPPATISSSTFTRGKMNRRNASAMEREVNIVAVRTTSADAA